MASSATLLGSPQKANNFEEKLVNISPMKQRYLDSLQNTGLMTEPRTTNNSPNKNTTPRSMKKVSVFEENLTSPLKKISKFSAISSSSSPLKNKKNESSLSFAEFKSAISSPKRSQLIN